MRDYEPLERKKRERDEALRRNQQTLDALLWRRAVIAQLGRFPDDRVVEALCDLVRPLVAAPAKAHEIEDVIDRVTALRHADQKLPHAMDVNAALPLELPKLLDRLQEYLELAPEHLPGVVAPTR